jgi:2-polyprenyl-3-methyl-5-hydroxy-6-metoxy-1,4-benzoquinol methylase
MTLERLEVCPVCKGTTFHPFLSCKDHTTTGEVFHVEQCGTCNLLLTNPRPLESQVSAYYQSANYISHTSKATGIVDYIYLVFRMLTIRWKLALIKHHLHNNSLLDVGCGTGHFLKHCSDRGVNTMGIEVSDDARQAAINNNLRVEKSLDSLSIEKFSVITLWHVLEHIYNLETTLRQLKDRLEENGTIFIAVPNWQSMDANHYQEYWAAYDVPRHLWHFSKATMTMLLEKNGLKLRGVIPMRLDAYYVSLLSEKYRNNGSTTLNSALSAISIAFKSNHQAKKDMNYSSLIYLAAK